MYQDANGEKYLSIEESQEYLNDRNAIFWVKQLYVYYRGRASANWETDELFRCNVTKLPGLELKLENNSSSANFIEDILSLESYYYLDGILDIAIEKDLLREFRRCEKAGGGFFIKPPIKLKSGTVNGVDWTNYEENRVLIKNAISFNPERVITRNDVCIKQSDLDNSSKLYGILKTVNQATEKVASQSINEIRNNYFKTWMEEHPECKTMNKAEIHEALMKKDPSLWASGFVDWWKQQDFIKKKSGRTKGK